MAAYTFTVQVVADGMNGTRRSKENEKPIGLDCFDTDYGLWMYTRL